MKIEKGTPGYLNEQRKKELVKAVVAFGLVIALIVVGVLQTGTKLNWMTFIAILGCLPASKVLVGVITRMPYRSISSDYVKEIENCTDKLTVAYDMIITSSEKIMPLSAIVISDKNVIGFTNSDKVDPEYLAKHITQILGQNHITNVSIKIFKEYKKFVTRAEGLNNMAKIDLDRSDCQKREETIRDLVLCISM